MFFATYTSAKGPRTLFQSRSRSGREYREFSFTLGEVKSILGRILNRKMRNNGVGRSLMFDLLYTGSCELSFADGKSGEYSGFTCAWRSGYELRFFGRAAQCFVNRLNDPKRNELALVATQRARDFRRDLRSRGLWQEPVRGYVQPRAGANARFRLHFKNNVLTWDNAVRTISKATKREVRFVQKYLLDSLGADGVATIREGNFSFRIDVVGYQGLLDLGGRVQLRTTNDNTHGVYRRLRNNLRSTLHRERKENQAVREQVRAWREQKRRLTILASL